VIGAAHRKPPLLLEHHRPPRRSFKQEPRGRLPQRLAAEQGRL